MGEKNDICVLWDGSNAGEFYRLRIKGVISSTSAIILRNTINPIVNKDYLFYFLKFYEIELKSSSIGMGIPHVDSFKMKNDVISFPSLKKQNIIVTELNSKTKKIGVLITEIKQSIEELKKYKQSLITEAVTKGLDPNAEMKDSGIEWIGIVPRNWNIVRIKNIFHLKGRIGWQGLTSKEHQSEGPHLITGTDFKNGTIKWDSCVRISVERYEEAPDIHIIDNDLLITKDGTIGKGMCIMFLNGIES